MVAPSCAASSTRLGGYGMVATPSLPPWARCRSRLTRPPKCCRTQGWWLLPVVAVRGAQVPWGKVVTQGVPVVSARRLPSMLRILPVVLGPERVAALADQARVRFRAAAEPHP